MKLGGLSATALAIAALSAAVVGARSPVPQATPAVRLPRAVALTFDDLPYVVVDGQQELGRAQRGTSAILRALSAHHAPAAVFVNDGKLFVPGEVDARIALLKRWVDAGAILGNHTYSHADFNTLTINEFEDEIVKGETVSRQLMRSRQPYQLYFRHPQTHTGDTEEKKQAIEHFLIARGYKITPHTIDSSDFIFNTGYVRSLRVKDAGTATRLRSAFLEFVMAATEFAERITPQVFGRDIPQTILLHANDINADCLNDLLQRLEARGYRFVTLDEAMSDPAYRTGDTLVTKSGPTWLWRWVKSKGMAISFAADPDPPDWVMNLYKRPSSEHER
jgi:peptidoglycan/xylan/chitin deacetylase (PgdA/CDA1 family)